ncbi:hypothetical protein, partial [Paramuribaculum intestinale]|uniref:hypothetical protein n=1 Tax=Paramuribaculum intestinale TaxID=2094151 RepID=UPI00272C30B8
INTKIWKEFEEGKITADNLKVERFQRLINRFYLFSANCLNSTNLVQWHIVIALIINTNIPKAKIDVSINGPDEPS